MKSKIVATKLENRVDSLIHNIRGERIIIDADLSKLYGVSTKRLNEQVRRNIDRFPADFAFQLTSKEYTSLRSQFATSSLHGGRRYRPYAFTEHGAIMAANVLNSKRAVQMSVFVVRAFVRMRRMLSNNMELTRKLNELEKELTKRLDVHETAIVGILQRIMHIIDPPALPEPKKRPIGFGERDT
jgi:phage regulator Rha-like protein